jgi:hypothetical protein
VKMRVTAVHEYILPDNLKERARIYGTTDPDECARIDQSGDPDLLLSLSVPVSFTVEAVRED